MRLQRIIPLTRRNYLYSIELGNVRDVLHYAPLKMRGILFFLTKIRGVYTNANILFLAAKVALLYLLLAAGANLEATMRYEHR